MDSKNKKRLDWPVFLVSGVFLIAFIVVSLINSEAVGGWVNTLFAYSSDLFGAYWQVLLLGNFFVGLGPAFAK